MRDVVGGDPLGRARDCGGVLVGVREELQAKRAMTAPLEDVKGFLDAVAYREGHPHPPGRPAYHPFVTISRQTGAGGHTLAHVLFQEMKKEDDPLFQGWQVFDRELCEKLLEDPQLHISMQSLLTEEYRSEIEDAICSLLGGETPRHVVVKKVFETIRTLATFGRVIIVGRAGMCVTKGMPDGLHLRLVASEATRIKRMMSWLQVDEAQARQTVYKQDLRGARRGWSPRWMARCRPSWRRLDGSKRASAGSRHGCAG